MENQGRQGELIETAFDQINLTRWRDKLLFVIEFCEALHRLEVESGNWGLAINRQKTKLMVIDRAEKLSGAYSIQGIEFVDSFIYLGSIINTESSCVPEIERRVAMAKDTMTSLQNI